MEKQEVIRALLPTYIKKTASMGFDIDDSPEDDSCLARFTKNGEYAFTLVPDGSIRFKRDTPYYDEVMRLTDILVAMKEAYTIFLNAEPLPFDDLSNYRPLSAYGDILLAARMEKDQSLHLVTWRYDYGHTGVMWGNYFGDNYAAAKQDFALRAGLIDKEKLFTEEELVVLYDACSFRGKNDDEISFDDEKKLQGVLGKIEDNIPNLLFDRDRRQEQETENGMEV